MWELRQPRWFGGKKELLDILNFMIFDNSQHPEMIYFGMIDSSISLILFHQTDIDITEKSVSILRFHVSPPLCSVYM